ncbi:MAG TPA: hypothetical protein VG389_24130 [Myxococcota bacterium]|jgi:hypothetical protein|nr:hypothetical protein [Myxococcota bacterium]
MGLLRYIVQGFGWEIGREAAREGKAAVQREMAEKEEADRARAEAAARATREAESAARTRAKEEAARAKAVEVELKALKKKVDRARG